ncbi:major facilitator superfamily domain-containing protein [Truncatella angustata]|uniref:Major facilitator superfamily domain-containing protein n=1 Tax=Truncatella angustata TaxID=152316 RepID=A0A9P8UU60_9PEZI|nr:major facilitator superfamily domain-containing protein [Truncatella angustata]KAH6658391.1 major facilitator superfamily domain-containing protein [Truncatella angustata]
METDLATARARGEEPALAAEVKSHSEEKGGGEQQQDVREAKTAGTSSGDDTTEADASATDLKVQGGLGAEEENTEYITGLKLALVMGSLTLTCFLMLLDTSIISTAIPSITAEFNSLPDIGWYTAAYQLASASLQPLTGKFYTHFKAKWVFLVFFIMFELGSLVCGLARSSSLLIGGRAIAGVGGSGLMNGGMTIIAGAVPLQKRPLYTGILMGFAQLGLICGPLIGGALTQYATWRWCFFINLPIGGLTGLLLVIVQTPDLTVKEPFSLSLVRKTIPELDLPGFVLFAPAAIMFLLALQWGGNEYAWSNSVIIGLFVGAGAAAIVFVLWERHMGDRAMVPGSLVRKRVVWSSAVNGMSLMALIFTAAQYFPVYFQAVKGEGPAMSGVDLLPSILSQLLMVIVGGALIQRVGYYLPFAVLSAAISAVGNGLITTYTPWTSTARWVGYQILLGGGRGLGMQLGLIAVQNVLSPHQIPVGVAFLIFCQNFSGAVFVVVGSVIFTQSLVSEVQTHAPSVSPEAALAAGASAGAVRALVPAGGEELDGLLLAFSNSFNKVFYLLIAISFVGLFSAFGMGWTDVRKKKTQEKGEA